MTYRHQNPLSQGVAGGSAEWPPTLQAFSQVMHPQTFGLLVALPACPLGSTLLFPLLPSAGLKKAVTSLQTSWERLLAATWVMETIPVPPGTALANNRPSCSPHSKPFPPPLRDPFPLSRCVWGEGAAGTLLVSHPLLFHTISVFRDFSVASSAVLMCVKKTNQPEKGGLPAGLCSLIQLEFRDESGSGEQPQKGIKRGLLSSAFRKFMLF